MTSPLQYWESLVSEDEGLPLFEAAVAIAQDAYPLLDLADLMARIDAMALKLNERIAPDAPVLHRLRMLNHYFFDELHFHGNVNDYYDTDNSYLNRVIERRCGIPISLAAVYLELGQQIGLPLEGVSFPGHFLVKLKMHDGSVFIDVFDGGKSLSRVELEERLEPYASAHGIAVDELLPRFLGAASARDILARMLRNLKGIYTREGNQAALLAVLHRLVVLLPDVPIERRDRGLCYAALECPRAAMDDLQAYLESSPEAPDRAALAERIAALKTAADRLN